MAALRSLTDEQRVGFLEQEVDRLTIHGVRNKWDLDALRAAQHRLNQARAKLQRKPAA